MIDIRFDLMHLDNYAIIYEPCTFIVKNNSVLDYNNLYDEDGFNRWIINLKAIEANNLESIKELVNKDKVVTYKDIKHLLMSAVIWEKQVIEPIDLPSKGEDLIAVFDYVDDVLRCTNITLIPRKKPEVYLPASDLIGKIEEFEKLIRELNE